MRPTFSHMKLRNVLLVGDAKERLREIPDKSVDLVLTDPPYNTGMKRMPSATRFRNFFDDALPPDEYRALACEVCGELYRVLRADRAIYVFMGWKSLGVWLDELSRAGFHLKNVIVWDKVIHGMNYQNYAYTHEFLIFAVKGSFHPRNKGTGDDSYRDLWHIRREMRQPRNDEFHHETVKPVEVVRRPIEHASEPGDLVLDPFFGSGRILIVANDLGRDYLGIERDPRFYEMAQAAVTNDSRAPRSNHRVCDVRLHDHTPPRFRRTRKRATGKLPRPERK